MLGGAWTHAISFLENEASGSTWITPLKPLKYIIIFQISKRDREELSPVRAGIPLRGSSLYLPRIPARGRPGIRERAFHPLCGQGGVFLWFLGVLSGGWDFCECTTYCGGV